MTAVILRERLQGRERLMGENLGKGLFQPGDMVLDAALALVFFKVAGQITGKGASFTEILPNGYIYDGTQKIPYRQLPTGDIQLSDGRLLGRGGGGRELLPGEGKVGTYDDLIASGTRGDNLTPHHIPSDAYMSKQGPEGYTRGTGIAINMEQPFPGTGGRHRATFSYGSSPDLSLTPRQALAREVWDVHEIYMKNLNSGTGMEYIRRQLQNVINLNKQAWPRFYDKPSS